MDQTVGSKSLIIAAVTMPAWLPSLHKLSEAAAEIAPILGVFLLVLQIVLKLWNRR